MGMKNLLVSLRQPSAWRGVLYIITAAGLTVKPELQEAIVAAGLAAAGLIGVVFSDAAPVPSELREGE
jgi:hypothetical protein